MTAPYVLTVLILLAILAGSFLGSIRAYVSGGGNSRSAPAAPGYAKPAGWPTRNSGATAYTAQHAPSGGFSPLRAMRMVLGLGLVAGIGAAALFSYRSPWPVEIDIRHLAAAIHCEVAAQVGLAQATTGQPGYHQITDRDGNGVSCDGASGVASAQRGLVLTDALPAQQLSGERLSWPTITASQ